MIEPNRTTHHVLHISYSDRFENFHGYTEFEDLEWSLDCPGCNGWTECTGDHTGFDVGDEDSPAYDMVSDDEIEIHGVLHTWRYAAGNWTVPFNGCVVAEYLAENSDDVYDIARTFGQGDYLVEDDWWDTYCVTVTALCNEDGTTLIERKK